MDEPIQIEKVGEYQIKVWYDIDPINPRKEFEPFSKVVHWHRHYDLGKRIEPISKEELILESIDDPVVCILPLYLFDHSGIAISTEPFSCAWDSGQVGWVYITLSEG